MRTVTRNRHALSASHNFLGVVEASARLEWITQRHPEVGEAWLYLGRVEARRSNRRFAASGLRRAAVRLNDPALELEAGFLTR